MENKTLVKSKQRVIDHGEVFTSEREVNAMLDLVSQETERIDSRFLEPACGDGNFLVEVLHRKLMAVKKQYGKNASDYEKYSVVAICSIYGVELLKDNVQECRERLFSIWDSEYTENVKKAANDACRNAVRFILRRNILCGNALNLRTENGVEIVFSEWSLVTGSLMKRRDFLLAALLEGEEKRVSQDLFMASNEGWHFDDEIQAFIPDPICEYPLIDYRRVQVYE